MNAMTMMAGQLQARQYPGAPTDNTSRAGRMRAILRAGGTHTAKELAQLIGLTDSGLVSALLKWDVSRGRIARDGCNYTWKGEGLREVLEWHEIAADDFPDAGMTVLARLRDASEPVWLAHWTGEEWLDTEGMAVDVVRWADLPGGGEA